MKIKNIIGFAIGPFGSAILGFLTLPILAWNFSSEDIARLNILQVTISFSLLFFVLGLDQAYVREYHESKDQNLLLKVCFMPGFILLLLTSIISLGFVNNISNFLYGNFDARYYTLTLICIICTYISRYQSLILRMQERGLAYSMSQLIPKIIQLFLLGCIILLGLNRDFHNLLWISAISIISITTIYTINTRKQLSLALSSNPSLEQTKVLLKFGLPLVLTGIAYWGLTATSTLMLRSKSTLGELGIYSITTSISGIASIFQSIFSVVWIPSVYKWVKQDINFDLINDISNKAIAAICSIFAIVGLFSWVTDFILPSYYSNIKYLILCAIAPPLLYTLSEITCIGIGITRKTTLTIWVTLTALSFNILFNFYLIPNYGAKGAIISNAIAYLIFFIARTEVSAHVWRNFPRLHLYFILLLTIGTAIITAFFGEKMPFHQSIPWAIPLPIIYYIYHKKINFLIISVIKSIHKPT